MGKVGEQQSEGRGRVPAIIAIDGPGAAGKSAVGSRLARRLRYRFVDTGSMYRALTWLALRKGVDPQDEEAVAELAAATSMQVEMGSPSAPDECTVRVNGLDATAHLRSPEVEAAVSWVSRVARARRVMVEVQRRLAGEGRVVMAGRDIGTVVLLEADLKVYLDASPEVRARRRHEELAALGQPASLEGIRQDLARRDDIDSSRETSPLKPAADATIIDTNDLTLDEVVQQVLSLTRCR